MDKIIIEARVNELAARDENPNVPFLPSEIIRDAKACYDEGASIIHYHGRTATGEAEHDAAFYLQTNAGIRAQCPILVHPTLGYVANDADAMGRFAAVEEMMKRPETAPDFAPMDIGSVNVDWWDPENNTYTTTNLVYENSTETLMHFADRIKHHQLKQYLVSWNISFTRQIEAFMKMGVITEPAIVLLCMTDGTSLAGHPGTPEGLDAHTTFLPKDRNVLWSAMNYKGNLLLLTEKVIKAGGHISIGLGDYPYLELGGTPTNADIIAKVVEQARALGREPATVEETREILQMGTPRIAA
ncbi:MAG: 3-keto-5-aminohexanoate cleavage protein [Alphaproteobacteria bacterium]|nr:3-keto-5-aminohexanoate cleavage protein [Alphaproteobacteria bacterium]